MSEQIEQEKAPDISTPQHEARKKAAADRAAKKSKGKQEPVDQWIEVIKRVPNEVGKVLLKTITESGATHSWYVGRETKALAWLKEQAAAGVEIYDGYRENGEGRKYKFK